MPTDQVTPSDSDRELVRKLCRRPLGSIGDHSVVFASAHIVHCPRCQEAMAAVIGEHLSSEQAAHKAETERLKVALVGVRRKLSATVDGYFDLAAGSRNQSAYLRAAGEAKKILALVDAALGEKKEGEGGRDADHFSETWRPGTDIAAAFEALNKFAGRKHYSYRLSTHDGTGGEEAAIRCEIFAGNPGSGKLLGEGLGGRWDKALDDWEDGNPVCLAICRALLAAVGEK